MADKSIDYKRDDEYEDPYESSESETPLVAAVLSGDANAVQNLIDRGIDVDRFDACIEGWALGVAIEQNRSDLVKILLDAGASPDAGDISYNSLELAARQNDIDIFQLLLAAGADINQEGENDRRIIMTVAKYGNLAMVKLLVEAGAEVNLSYGGALSIAAEIGNRDIYDYLYPLVNRETREYADKYCQPELEQQIKKVEREQRKDIEQFIENAKLGDLTAVRQAIASGINIDEIGSKGQTALMFAAYYGRDSVIETLIDAGANLDLTSDAISDEEGRLGVGMTALMHAVNSIIANRDRTIQLLIDRGANIDLQGEYGKTALMFNNNYRPALKVLIRAGANLDLKDSEGNTALMLATLAGYGKAIELLKAAGASLAGLK
ncbi:ankyrin repeat domain-containing protein [Chamaesiphon minutus]|uniref:Ankyrin repeat-containing protein n=1 Tax=Chamaesiphon minutus (strain ATCC 27169 / PCC 6605) TaxID=1173020 RepID=K9UED4_CHAP6|nr:ankyrin repeat domain-containing protein [Chamaesiphon minutus]AFY93482.1 ankyrin repeat-containing protein [Chamaesiphon minutus PCC 6605]